MSWFFIMVWENDMQNIDTYEIDLTLCENSEALANDVVSKLEGLGAKNAYIKLKLGKFPVSQSQMVFIKSLVESFGHILSYVDCELESSRNVCIEAGISTEGHEGAAFLNAKEVENSTLDDLREEFRASFQADEITNEENINQEKDEDTNAKEAIKEEKEQVIGVYRKADEKENEAEFQEEDVTFYAVPTNEEVVADSKKTIYINQTLRNGQVLDYDGNVVIIGDCHPGSEIRATGDITVWGVLGSIAHAGIKGNEDAKIRALKMNAVQLRIANCYSRRPDGGNIPYIVKSSVFTPEEARIVDDNIVLFRMAQD